MKYCYQGVNFKLNGIFYKLYVHETNFLTFTFIRQYNKTVFNEELIFTFPKECTAEYINCTLYKITFCELHQANHLTEFCPFNIIESEIVECPICLSEFKEHTLKLTACKHMMCYKCYYKLEKLDCPICRQSKARSRN